MIETIRKTLKQYRDKTISRGDFYQWLPGHLARFQSSLKRSTYLKLKNGFPESAILEMLPRCNICQAFPGEIRFSNRSAFDVYFKLVSDLKVAGKIISIKEPDWLNYDSEHLGVAAFYKCSDCDSVWDFAEPEKEFCGFWERIA